MINGLNYCYEGVKLLFQSLMLYPPNPNLEGYFFYIMSGVDLIVLSYSDKQKASDDSVIVSKEILVYA